jgi:hypothetical protein
MKTLYSFLFIALFAILPISAQNLSEKADKLFGVKKEIQFKFQIQSRAEISKLTRIISIDNVKDNYIYAYANKKEFLKFLELGYEYQLINDKEEETDYNMLENLNYKDIQAWNFYPTYNAYDSLMSKFQTNFPNLCRSFSIKTLASGRKLLFVKISDNPDVNENEPKFLYTSSMHGDELTGYILMLRLIEYLLSNYGTDARITSIINNTEIWINPLANPDGTFALGNNTVAGATRYNANGIDFNRNFPDPYDGQHPDGNAWQPETMAFMALADSIQFTMSANIHGGAEVCNYPFDTWAQLPADNNWWNYVCREYADTVHVNGIAGYLDDLDNGVTNGYAWYQITGGRQDYMNYFAHCREFCLEISNTKKPAASTLPNYWNYNYRSLLNYLEQCQYGIKGIVTDSITGIPLKASVFIQGHDMDSSHVYSTLPLGNYYRPIYAGNYNVTYSAPGYYSKTISSGVVNKTSTIKDVQLVPIYITTNEIANYPNINIYPNPANNKINILLDKNYSYKEVTLTDIYGKKVFEKTIKSTDNLIEINVHEFSKGLYFVILEGNNQKISQKIVIE